MPRPVFDHLWKHTSYQVPLRSDRICDLISVRETEVEGNMCLQKIYKSMCWDLDFDFQTFGAGSREEISRRFRIRNSPDLGGACQTLSFLSLITYILSTYLLSISSMNFVHVAYSFSHKLWGGPGRSARAGPNGWHGFQRGPKIDQQIICFG